MEIKRYHPDPKIGLTDQEVNQRIDDDLLNYDATPPTKTLPRIIRDNLFTLFNLLNLGLGLAIFLVGSYKNLMFLGVVFCNTAISTFQEIRSKRTVDKLSLLASSKVTVMRNGRAEKIEQNEVVLDDIMILKPGNQVVCDAIVQTGETEVNESCITGEPDPIHKEKGDMILSGSFLVRGTVTARVEHIGADNYTSTISQDAKYVKKVNSELMRSLNKIIKYISIAIVPIGLILFWNQFRLDGNTLSMAVVNTVAAIIGMIPEGLVLLTSTVLAVSVIRLSKNRVLVQELYCIETLARVDTICLDKTGTITEGYMEVKEIIPLDGKEDQMKDILAALSANLDDDNATMDAISRKYNRGTEWQCTGSLPFSSAYKFSGATFKNKGTYLLGAPEILLKNNHKLASKIAEYSKQNRVILLAKTESLKLTEQVPATVTPLALILLRDKIRFQAHKTLEYFKEQGVDIKIISGDNIVTVGTIAERVGVENVRAIDISELANEDLIDIVEVYNVFGRVKPDQKKLLIEALQKKGHTVAMTGDGVNDVLALKAADCSVAMASGTDAARNVSQLVLLDSNFDAMPEVVVEGRRTINNIERSASLFLVKTIYATILAVLFIFINAQYPFMPIQLTLTNIVTIGIPSFILALEPNKERIRGNFLLNVLRRAFPTALTIVMNIVIIMIVSKIFRYRPVKQSTLAVIVTAFTGFMLLYRISKPFNLIRKILFVSMITIFLVGILGLRELFSLAILTPHLLGVIALLTFLSLNLWNINTHFFEWIEKKFPKIFSTD